MKIKTATEAWLDLIAEILNHGGKSTPRGLPIREIIGNSVKIDMRYPIVLNKARKLSYRFMAAEAWWILSGKNDVESISRYCKSIARFSDDGEVFFGAYGPKVSSQFGYVVDKLSEDPDSRQAVINIWRENPRPSKDIPCTISAQWLIRDNKIHCIDTMRSNDAWLGFPYDVFNFSMLSVMLLEELKSGKYPTLELGTLTLNAGSHHLYEPDAQKILAFSADEWRESLEFGHEAGKLAEDSRAVVAQLGKILGEYSYIGIPLDPFFREFKLTLIGQ